MQVTIIKKNEAMEDVYTIDINFASNLKKERVLASCKRLVEAIEAIGYHFLLCIGDELYIKETWTDKWEFIEQ